MDEYRRELYKERAEWADLESDVDETSKYMHVGGWFWRFGQWVKRMSERNRAEIEVELKYLDTDKEGQSDADRD